jgi:hypothetical protein
MHHIVVTYWLGNFSVDEALRFVHSRGREQGQFGITVFTGYQSHAVSFEIL